jgi:hypothetical protein
MTPYDLFKRNGAERSTITNKTMKTVLLARVATTYTAVYFGATKSHPGKPALRRVLSTNCPASLFEAK